MKLNRVVEIAAVISLAASASRSFAQWSEPVNVSRLTSGVVAWYPSLAIDSFGTLHASWSHRMSNDADWIEYSCKPAGVDTWTLPVRVSRDSFPYRVSAVAVGAGHKPHVVWQSDVQAGHLYIAHKDGDTWTIPKRLEAWNGNGTWLRAEADRFGRIHVVWNSVDNNHIWYACYQDTSWVVLDSIVNDTNPYALGGPDVVAGRDGFPRVVYRWTRYQPNARYYVTYVRQTQAGWTPPETLPKAFWDGDPRGARIALDTADQPQVVWSEVRWPNTWAIHLGWTSDSWNRPFRLDTTKGYAPALCVDPRNQTHVVFADDFSFFERVREPDGWGPFWLIDTMSGQGEVVADSQRVHLLWRMATPGGPDVYYSSRRWATGIQECDAGQMKDLTAISGPNPVDSRTTIVYELRQAELVRIDILDSVGRLLATPVLAEMPAGRYLFRPYQHLPGRGVYFCRITYGGSEKAVKLIKTK